MVKFDTDGSGKQHKYGMVQYTFDGPEREVKIKPHENSKGNRPYFRTSSTMKERIREVAKDHKPKAAVDILTKEQGGDVEAKSAASLPRGCRQISYARHERRRKDVNLLYSIMLECKTAQSSSQMFVQDVKAAHTRCASLNLTGSLMTWLVFLLTITASTSLRLILLSI